MSIKTSPERTLQLVASDLHQMADRLRGVLDGRAFGVLGDETLHGIRQQLDLWARSLDKQWPPLVENEEPTNE